MDPGLLKPVVQTLLQLLKSPRLVTVKHCLRIVSAISNSQRGSEILLEMSTALYLRQGSPDDHPPGGSSGPSFAGKSLKKNSYAPGQSNGNKKGCARYDSKVGNVSN